MERNPIKSKCCGTCIHWSGMQKADPNGISVINDENERATCMARTGTTKCYGSCSKWEPRFKR